MDPHHICTVSKINSLWGIYKDHHMKGLNVKGVAALQKGNSQQMLFTMRLVSKYFLSYKFVLHKNIHKGRLGRI